LSFPKNIILASSSRFRADLLEKAGVVVSRETPQLNERELEKHYYLASPEKLASPEELACILAAAKAQEVGQYFPDAVVIGCDQILACEGQILHKVRNKNEAAQRLRQLSGKTHYLHSAISLWQKHQSLWQYQEQAALTMNILTDRFIEDYLQQIDEDAMMTAGIYQIEGIGIRLFNKIEGDFFTIIGLSLLPLLNFLRKMGIIDA